MGDPDGAVRHRDLSAALAMPLEDPDARLVIDARLASLPIE